MKLSDIHVGMKVIPTQSTHPSGVPLADLNKYNYMPAGFLKVCEISDGNPANVTIHCYKNRIHTAWGREMYNKWRWLKFRPEDLKPLTKNDEWFLKMLKGG